MAWWRNGWSQLVPYAEDLEGTGSADDLFAAFVEPFFDGNDKAVRKQSFTSTLYHQCSSKAQTVSTGSDSPHLFRCVSLSTL
jgi:hypothetical protein